MKDVAIIATNEGIMIRGLESRFAERGVKCVFVGTEHDMLSAEKEQAGVFLVCFQDDMDDISAILTQVREISVDKGVAIVVMADKIDQSNIRKFRPDFATAVDAWFEREGGADDMMEAVLKHLKEEVGLKEKKNILIVDDDPTYAKMVREWLKDSYHVSVVINAMQAITFMTKHPTDLVLLDYEMPVVSGPQVFEMMHAEPETSNIPVVFLTGVGDAQSVAKVIALKPAGYLLKSSSREAIQTWLVNFFYK